jgi:predicted RNase H-like HicB family nuclease
MHTFDPSAARSFPPFVTLEIVQEEGDAYFYLMYLPVSGPSADTFHLTRSKMPSTKLIGIWREGGRMDQDRQTLRMRSYLVIFEQGKNGGWGACATDLPGLGVAAETREEVASLIREGIAIHIAGLREDGLPIPAPTTTAQRIAMPNP